MEVSLIITLLVILLVLDVLIYGLLHKRYLRILRYAAYIAVLLTTFLATVVIGSYVTILSMLFVVVSLFRVLHFCRVAIMRMRPEELQQRYIRTGIVLQVVLVGIIWAVMMEYQIYWNWLVLVAMVLALILCSTAIRSIVTWRRLSISDRATDTTLPTVSICIPARNETPLLPDCIETMLSQDYPKLEVLVLDDCSHDKTPDIIKQYAHQGVRFVRGTDPSDDWLSKNQAMDKLLDESNGDIVIFAGVDTRFGRDTVRTIVYQLSSGKDMLSILPLRTYSSELSLFIQPLRYWWELAVPRFKGRPPVLSTAWAARRKSIESLGGFESYRRSVQPEAHFAKHLRGAYGFIISGNRLGITSVKQPREQFDTAIRTRYPQLQRRPETVLLVLLLEALLFVLPITVVVLDALSMFNAWLVPAVITMVLLSITNIAISSLTVRRLWLLGAINGPLLVAVEWFVLVKSMLAYEFGTVIWKERNICLPMFQVESSLPSID